MFGRFTAQKLSNEGPGVHAKKSPRLILSALKVQRNRSADIPVRQQ